MAKKLRPGREIRGYRIVRAFDPGALALAYEARDPDDKPIFLKQYKSPSVTLPWYEDYLEYQEELAHRIEHGPARNHCIRLIEAFEERYGGPTYFQTYEFLPQGRDLETLLGEGDASTLDWSRRVTWAKVFMAGLKALHASRIAHCDLKPANIFMIEDSSIMVGYRLRLIDMDYSVLTDRQAPWHGHQGYVGTEGYRSPEHMQGDDPPGTGSDVFTASLILYELLAEGHPYRSDDEREYRVRVFSHAAGPPVFRDDFADAAAGGRVAALLHQALDPEPAGRPSAEEIHQALIQAALGTDAGASAASPTPAAPAAAPSRPASAPAAAASATPTGDGLLRHARIRLVSESGEEMELGIRTELGRRLCRRFGDASAWESQQCVIERAGEGHWQVRPFAGTTNETLLNDETLEAPAALREGDVIAVGRAKKGVAVLPLTVTGV